MLIGLCLVALATPGSLFAQSAVDETPADKFIFGPLGLTPRIALRNVGMDTNPFNLPGETDQDFTATIQPGVDSSLRIGRARLSGRTSLEYLYFQDAASQRSLNFSQEGRLELTLNRLRPYMFGGYLRTRQRPTPEIDLRVQQVTTNGGVGTGIRLGGRLRADAEVKRARYEFGEGRHGSIAVAHQLDRDSNLARFTTRFILTPLTTFLVRSDLQHDRFRYASVRDNNSFSVVPGFELKPLALISGSVLLGYKRFDAQDETVPDYSGVVGEIDAQYVMRETTLFNVQGSRDVVYSIELDQPYFVQTAGTLSVVQMMGLHWFVSGRIGQTALDYRGFVTPVDAPGPLEGRTDRVFYRGFGIGRRLGDDIRVSFDVNHVQRRTNVARSNYEGFRFGGSISYGTP